MKAYSSRIPNWEYQNLLRLILSQGELVKDTPQGVGALTYLDTPPMRFDLSEGFPIITERNISFWKASVGELLAFINGARTIEQIETYSPTAASWWSEWATERKCAKIGVATGDMGPSSYGAAFHDFPMPNNEGYNQWKHLVEAIKERPTRRTMRITPWIPYMNGWGKNQGAVVSPCHGDVFVRIMGNKLHMGMRQRSGDVPVGVVSNIIQYSAIMMLLCQLTGYTPGIYTHSIWDAHIYENQIEAVKELLEREPRPFPTLSIDPSVDDLFSARTKHFSLSDYDPYPALSIPVAV